jgi:serine protease AprX
VAAHYQHVDGTSFAAPIVASLVAQLLERQPGLCPVSMKQVLLATADRIQGAPAIRQGYGVVNAARAAALVANDPHIRRCTPGQPPRIEGDRLVFTFHDDAASRVALYGDFRGGMGPLGTLARMEDGLWRAVLETPLPGRYRYKFIVDNARWVEDPTHGLKENDGFGGYNSVLNVRWDIR